MTYKICLCDPAWSFETYSDKGRDRSPDYHLSSLDRMKSLTVPDIMDKDSVCVMWATYPQLPEALELLEAWGYKYTTTLFTWVKLNKTGQGYFMGLGYYTRANPEIAILGKRGKGLPVLSHDIPNLIVSRIRKHSQKPDEVRDKIVQLFGDLPRIELFARRRWTGWSAWGSDVKSDVSLGPGEIMNENQDGTEQARLVL